MNPRYTFYWILWGLGELSGLGQWLLLRWGLPVPEHGLLLIFLLLPFIYLIPNILGNHLPLRVTRLLARIGGYWFIYGYYMTLLLLPAFVVWLVCLAQPFGFGLDWWHTVFAVYYGKASLLGLPCSLSVAGARAIRWCAASRWRPKSPSSGRSQWHLPVISTSEPCWAVRLRQSCAAT